MNRASPPGELIRLGRIAGAHGLRGAVRLRLDNPDSSALTHLTRITIEHGGQRREYRILDTARAGAGAIRVTLEGVADADAAQALRGAVAMAPAGDLPALGPREFYYRDLIGCDVRTTDGRALGAVAEVFSAGASEVLVVRNGEREVLVPAIEDVIKSMDLKERHVVIEPVPGLLD
jgi:16S rRNA processing protein RimM